MDSSIEQINLLRRFNKRDTKAFESVYNSFYRELYAYTSMLYYNIEIEAEDVIHDIFVDLWVSKVQFESLNKAKAYIYVGIKNDFKNYLRKNKCSDKYCNTLSVDASFGIDVFECEVYSEVDESLKALPEDYAKVVRMLIDGYKSSEIADIMGRTKQNIYNIKYEAINTLKRRLTKNKMLIIMLMLAK